MWLVKVYVEQNPLYIACTELRPALVTAEVIYPSYEDLNEKYPL